jgi:hypothetical protein
MSKGWIGVDFDGTLAKYETWVSPEHCGEPIEPMVERVKRWLAEGREVRIFTARVFPLLFVAPGAPPATWQLPDSGYAASAARMYEAGIAAQAIQRWCRQHLGQELIITCVKDYSMIELWDDRAVQVHPNTGEVVGQSTRGLT